MFLFQHINICNNISLHFICVDDTKQTGILPKFVKIVWFFLCTTIQTVWSVFGLCSPLKILSRHRCYCIQCEWLLAERYLHTQPSTEKNPASIITPKWIAQINSPGLSGAFVDGKEIERFRSFSGISYWGIRGFGIML